MIPTFVQVVPAAIGAVWTVVHGAIDQTGRI
jgi:hypothetical protein